MSYGYEVSIRGVTARLDSSYENIVRSGVVYKWLSVGYHEIDLSAYGHQRMICAARHINASMSFLGYTFNGTTRVGVRIYTSTGGSFYFACFKPFTPIYNADYGTVIYDAGGNMRFHSGHNYMDILRSGTVSRGDVSAAGGFYILSNATYPGFTYRYTIDAGEIPIWGWVDVPVQRLVTEYYDVYECDYSNPPVCSWVTRSRLVWKTFIEREYQVVGKEFWFDQRIYCTKEIDQINQNESGLLTYGSATLMNDELVFHLYQIDKRDGVFTPPSIRPIRVDTSPANANAGSTIVVKE